LFIGFRKFVCFISKQLIKGIEKKLEGIKAGLGEENYNLFCQGKFDSYSLIKRTEIQTTFLDDESEGEKKEVLE
jgi:hypothetical protein